MPNLPRNIADNSLKDLDLLENQETVYLDPSRKGFLLTIDIRGIKTFSFEYKFNKLLRSISIGTHPNISLNKARLKWLEYSKKVLDGKDVWLYNKELQSSDAFHAIPKENKSRTLSELEIIHFWKKIDSINQISAITKLALKLILITGIKKNSLLKATWDDIDIKKRIWYLDLSTDTFLNSLAIELLLEIKDFEHHTAYSNTKLKQAIINSNNKVINLGPKTLDRALNKKGCERLGIERFSPNNLADTHQNLLDKFMSDQGNSKERRAIAENQASESIAEYIRNLL